jgi:hypothetical protein
MWVGNSIEMNPVLIRVGNSVRLVPAYRAEIKGGTLLDDSDANLLQAMRHE